MHKLTHSYYAASRTTSFEEIHQQAAKTVKLKGPDELIISKKIKKHQRAYYFNL